MASRDSQTVILSRQAIVLVTAVGVGLLTLCYVLGVQVGKQSAALRSPQSRGAGEDLEELPSSVAEQLKAFQKEGAGSEQLKAFEHTAAGPEGAPEAKPATAADPAKADAAKPDSGKDGADRNPKPAAKPEPGKPAAKPDPGKPAPKPDSGKPAPKPDNGRPSPAPAGPVWGLQLVSTPDPAEAQRMATRARDAGFPTVTVKDGGLLKVRLSQTGTRDAVDATATKLKNRGFKPFAVHAQ
jgi:hypothetical protein